MAKGTSYRLVTATGYRPLFLPLTLWPALTGFISDNEFQFSVSCYKALVEEVINMPWQWIPESFHYTNYFEWSSTGWKEMNVCICPADKSRRYTQLSFLNDSASPVQLHVLSIGNSDEITIVYSGNVPANNPLGMLVDVRHSQGDFVRFRVNCQAATGTFYIGLWAEEWTN